MHLSRLNPLTDSVHITEVKENKEDQNTDLFGGTYVPLPKAISATKGLINVKNNDNLCFLHSISALKFTKRNNPDRVSHDRKYLTEYKYNKEEFPMSIS